MKTNIRLFSVLNWIVVCRRFDLSTFWSIDVWVCRRFGLSTIWSVDVSVCQRLGCQRFDWSTCWPVTYKGSTFTHQSLVTKMIIILRTTYPNGFLQWHLFFIISLSMSYYSLNMIYILLYTYLISSICFLHSNTLTRASHHWCLASNIVLVPVWHTHLIQAPDSLGLIVWFDPD